MRTIIAALALTLTATTAIAQQRPKVPTGIDVPGPTCYRYDRNLVVTPSHCESLAAVDDAINNRRNQRPGFGSVAGGSGGPGGGDGGGGSSGNK